MAELKTEPVVAVADNKLRWNAHAHQRSIQFAVPSSNGSDGEQVETRWAQVRDPNCDQVSDEIRLPTVVGYDVVCQYPQRKSRKTKVPKFFVDDSIPNAAADHAFHYSDDRRRMHATVSNVQRQQAPSAEALPDPDDGWVPVSHEDMEELEDVTRGLTSADTGEDVYMHQIEEDEVAPGKRKRYVTSDRYVAFGRMSRQYRYLKRAKRAGVGHLPKGFADARRGKLAVPCWACPQDGFNLPDGWENCHPDDEFLYALLLALDANFRLKNRIRTNERKDQSLTCGLGVFVETEAYKQNLSDYVSEEDISTCIAFAALMQKDTRLTKGLRVSGVGGCVCARHGVVRAQGLGDLQKGERYANMDYILMRALVDARVKRLVLSYDIACQWKQNLRTRVLKILDPNGDLPKLDDYNIQFGLPVWHAAAHEVTCQMTHSLSYATGVGRTDGEGIERTWSVLNPMAFSTKEMGEGNRHDTLEDKVDHVSFEKNIAQGDVLARKLLIAVAERDKQDKEFAEVDKSLMADLRQEWQAQINDWVADKSKPNPYMMAGGAEAGPSEAKVAAELKEAEVAEARAQRGEFVDGKMTGAAFVKALLQLEDLKRRIRNEIKTTQTLTAERASQIDELRASFFKKLNAMQEQQATYMAGVGLLRDAEEEKSERDKARRRAKGEKVVETETKAEETKLWLPSDLTKTERWGSRKGLFAVEAKLRRAQCNDALARIRHLLYARTHLIYQRNANAVGQRATTRSSTLISRVTEKIEREFVKYQEGYLALGRLDRAGYTGVLAEYAPELRVLARDDLNVRAETESDAAARTRLGRVGSRPLRNEPTQPKKKKSTQNKTGQNQPTADEASPVSWIWFAVAADEEVRVHDAVRVQWAKALARRDRWREEVRLLREEMKRVLRSLKTIQRQWESWATQRIGVDPALSAGLRAYAMRQIHVHRSLAETFCLRWTEHSSPVARRILTQDAEIYSRLLRGERDSP
ncbi:hypothetical protein HMN09_00237800 [Mycena chlorophos]|uniref:CxC2-like cysteine cluster KDZ transposase-associated domain-containing protein n=1 Tax=Mycena chlorophos TaxID=658473 RepID=A0A8H6TLT6_MYCCL|nr:hypothetical protein HMN09_00237800 [Mycena chlorophos]